MNPSTLVRHVGVALLLSASLCQAQNALYAEHNGKFRLVRRVVNSEPYVDDGTGKIVAASSNKFGLAEVPEYLPLYVSIRHLHVETSQLNLIGSGAEINKEFHFAADFESPYPLKNVFVVLDMKTEDAGNVLFVREVGNLMAREAKPVRLRLALNQKLGPGQFQIHVFTEGAEVFHSEMPFAMMEHKLDQIVRRRVEGVTDAPPKPFIGPDPEYPEKLRRDKIAGSAQLHFTVSPTGRVQDPVVKAASKPEFGEAALVAIRQWRFLPRMEKGRAVATAVEIPFSFAPPERAPAK